MGAIENLKLELAATKKIAKAVEGFDKATAKRLLEAVVADLAQEPAPAPAAPSGKVGIVDEE